MLPFAWVISKQWLLIDIEYLTTAIRNHTLQHLIYTYTDIVTRDGWRMHDKNKNPSNIRKAKYIYFIVFIVYFGDYLSKEKTFLVTNSVKGER